MDELNNALAVFRKTFDLDPAFMDSVDMTVSDYKRSGESEYEWTLYGRLKGENQHRIGKGATLDEAIEDFKKEIIRKHD